MPKFPGEHDPVLPWNLPSLRTLILQIPDNKIRESPQTFAIASKATSLNERLNAIGVHRHIPNI